MEHLKITQKQLVLSWLVQILENRPKSIYEKLQEVGERPVMMITNDEPDKLEDNCQIKEKVYSPPTSELLNSHGKVLKYEKRMKTSNSAGRVVWEKYRTEHDQPKFFRIRRFNSIERLACFCQTGYKVSFVIITTRCEVLFLKVILDFTWKSISKVKRVQLLLRDVEEIFKGNYWSA